MCILQNQQGHFLGAHFRSFFLNSSEDLIFLEGKTAHILGLKDDVPSSPKGIV